MNVNVKERGRDGFLREMWKGSEGKRRKEKEGKRRKEKERKKGKGKAFVIKI